ncbi:MAG: ABC transporter ATP-binding protein [Alphaproteobacteria bacterium]|nr:ABC transporter ATP-binding protein [Alphaproteobacteria bacterium]
MVTPSNVSVRDLEVAFGPVKVLDRLSLEVAQSEFVVLLGPSGCGKSTLLNAIAGLLDIKGGQVWIGERNVTWEEPKDRGIAMVFQSYALYPRMRVRDNLSFGLKVAGRPRAEIDTRVKSAAEMLRITELLDRRPAELSGGQRQRVAIGRALVREAPVFLFDEPLSNLDAQLRAELRVEIKRLHQRLGATMIYVTHDQIEALTLADRIAVMRGGEIQQLDTPHKVYLEPANRFVASFVGSPAMNFVSGKLAGGDGGDGGAPVFESPDLRMPLDGYRFATAPARGAAVTLGVRPEHVVLDAGGEIATTVEMVEPMGADSLVWCRSGGTSISVRLDGERRARLGETARLDFSRERLSLFDEASGRRL